MSEYEPHLYVPSPLTNPVPLPTSGMTSDCARVQSEIIRLADLLATVSLGASSDFVQRTLGEVRQARHDLADHAEWIEGPAGLFQYVGESVPCLMPQIQCLCRQHQQLDACLAELEGHLIGYDATDPEAERRIQQCARKLGDMMQAHRVSAGALADEARQP